MDFNAPIPYDKMINHPSNLISKFSYWQAVVSQLLLAGNAYVVITERDDHNIPIKLEYASPSQTSIILSDDSQNLTYQITWNDDRGQKKYAASDVLHFRLMSPYGQSEGNYLIGMSPLYSLQKDVAMQEQSKHLALNTLVNAINPSFTITLPNVQVSKEDKDKVRDSFQEANSGENAGKTIVLDQSAELKVLSVDSDVANFLNNYDFSQSQIAKAFLIPNSVLDDRKGDQQSNIADIGDFYVNSLSPYINAMKSEFELKLGIDIKVDITNATDLTNNKFISQLATFATGRTPAIPAELAQKILASKGIFGLKAKDITTVTDTKGGETKGGNTGN
ncbi:phage portal protein, HK97 family [Liquorilactobacillus uvarum DSM 19971]|uniref:Phage portal protein, HK97 family n=1 Tax=Liquorilactobacillus uvarum DSM 19971 TaxID=1423812 RepID=A0A0R1PVM1_9LACO|nr:phage portal protein, HK97 family [Liquorilactobacillus uvarum DSM 19971]